MEEELYAGAEFSNELLGITKRGFNKAGELYEKSKPYIIPLAIGATLLGLTLFATTNLVSGQSPVGMDNYGSYYGNGNMDLSWYYQQMWNSLIYLQQQSHGCFPQTNYGFYAPPYGPPQMISPMGQPQMGPPVFPIAAPQIGQPSWFPNLP